MRSYIFTFRETATGFEASAPGFSFHVEADNPFLLRERVKAAMLSEIYGTRARGAELLPPTNFKVSSIEFAELPSETPESEAARQELEELPM